MKNLANQWNSLAFMREKINRRAEFLKRINSINLLCNNICEEFVFIYTRLQGDCNFIFSPKNYTQCSNFPMTHHTVFTLSVNINNNLTAERIDAFHAHTQMYQSVIIFKLQLNNDLSLDFL